MLSLLCLLPRLGPPYLELESQESDTQIENRKNDDQVVEPVRNVKIDVLLVFLHGKWVSGQWAVSDV
jgi:hypothetical protein